MAENTNRIVPLSEMEDFEVAEGEPDVRGWDVIAADGRRIGEVDQLLVDTSAMKVRYLDVDLDEAELNLQGDRHILVPIGYARLNEDDDRVIIDNLRSDNVANVPEYRPGPVTPEYENRVNQWFTGGAIGAQPTRGRVSEERGREEFRGGEARITRSEEELAVGKREVSAGEVEIEKHVETEHVRRPVELRHDEVEIERRPVTEQRAGAAPRIEEEEIHVPLTEEEAVVEKRPVVREELIVKKRPVEETEEVEADLRRERFDIEEHGRVEEERERREGRRGR